MGFAQFFTILILIFSHESLVSKGQSTTEVIEPDGQFHIEYNSTEPAVVKAIKDYLTRAAEEEYETWFWIAMPVLVLMIVGLIGLNIYM